MHIHSLRRSISLAIPVLLAAFVCTAGALGASASATGLAGTWTGKYSGAFSGTFTLHWKQSGSKLTGTIKLSRPKGTYGITGSVTRGKIRFGAVDAGATYTGTVSGTSMSGTYRSSAGGGGPWSAHKSSRG
jgi:hypothetical protein